MTNDTPHPSHAPKALLAAALVALCALAGCGSTNTTSTPTSAQAPSASATSKTPSAPARTTSTPAGAGTTASTPSSTPQPVAHTQTSAGPVVEKIVLSLPGTHYNGPLPARYTCDGQDTPPPLHWSGIPPGTREVLLEIIKVKPENNALSFAWAVSGIPPTSTGITSSQLPPGAIVGANYQGNPTYHLCPPKGENELYVVALFALLHHHPVKTGFDPAKLRLQAEHDANYQALYIVTYKRP